MGSQVQVLSDPPLHKLSADDRYLNDISWGLSLVGRAPALHAGGQEFDSPSLHQISRIEKRSFSLKFKQTAMLCAGTHRMELEVKKITELSKYNDLLISVINHSLM